MDRGTAQRLLDEALPGAVVAAVAELAGGLSNANFRVDLEGRAEPVALRLYARDPRQAGKEAALSRLVAPRVPAPPFLHLSEGGGSRPAWAVLGWAEGTRLDLAAPGRGRGDVEAIGRAVGGVLAAIHGHAMEANGFLGADLRVAERVDLGRAGLLGHLWRCLLDGPGGERLGAEATGALLRFAEARGHLLEGWLDAPCLVHADFNGSNLLVGRDAAGGWRVTAVLDWEFAFAGSPAFDFGNLLRPPLGALPGFAEAVAEGYAGAGGRLPEDWRRVSRIADLHAWADFLSRPDAGPELVEDARRAVAETVRGDPAWRVALLPLALRSSGSGHARRSAERRSVRAARPRSAGRPRPARSRSRPGRSGRGGRSRC
jgi:aminoglycoside phosphotransferase (APT) family kinase protein